MGVKSPVVSFTCSEVRVPVAAVQSTDQCKAGELSQCTFQLRHRCAALPFASISNAFRPASKPMALFTIARTISKSRIAEFYHEFKVRGDGKCMFRAIAQGLSRNQNEYLAPKHEDAEADALRLAVADVLCRSDKRRKSFPEAMPGVEVEGGLEGYCTRLQSPGFWGGEVELLVLSKLLHVPIIVYQNAKEVDGRLTGGVIEFVRYGEQYVKKRKPVRLLYSSGNHYDLLLPK